MKKKVIAIVALLILLIPIVAKAETCDVNNITIESIGVEKRDAGVFETEGTDIVDNKIKFDLNMGKVGDSAEYKIVVKNNGDTEYQVEANDILNQSSYLEYSIVSDGDANVIPANSSKELRLKVEYKNEVPESAFENGEYKDDQTVKLNLSSGEVELNTDEVNPQTGTLVFDISVAVLVISMVGLVFVFKNKKFLKYYIPAIGLLLIIPVTVLAVCKAEITVESSVKFANSLVKTVEQKTEGVLSPGDEVAVRGEHFYVVSSNENETVLLTKYNLYVGDVFLEGVYQGPIEPTDPAYGYQATEVTNVHVVTVGKDVGIVPFSGKAYWLDEEENVKEQYGSSSFNPMYGVNVFDNTFNKDRFTINKTTLTEDNKCVNLGCKAEESDYSIAYYVDNYVTLLKDMGLEVSEGRLLTDTEANELGCTTGNANNARCPLSLSWLNQGIYWMGSLYDKKFPRVNERGQMWFEEYNDIAAGVRPVIVINTNKIPLLDHEYFENKPEIVY